MFQLRLVDQPDLVMVVQVPSSKVMVVQVPSSKTSLARVSSLLGPAA